MVDTKELLGALLQRGMTDSSQSRIKNSLGEGGMGDLGAILEREFGVASSKKSAPTSARFPAPGPSRVPVDTQSRGPTATQAPPSSPFNRPKEAGHKGKPADAGPGGLGGMFGDSFKGDKGSGALALLGSIALKALRGAMQRSSKPEQLDSASRLAAGLREPENAQEEQQVMSLADLIVKAMVNAAKADGQIDEDEFQKIVGELQGDGITQEERDFLLGEVRKPMCTADIVAAVPDRQVGAQIYAASLLAIEVDTPAEKSYMQQLARDLNLDSQVIGQIHSDLGVA